MTHATHAGTSAADTLSVTRKKTNVVTLALRGGSEHLAKTITGAFHGYFHWHKQQ